MRNPHPIPYTARMSGVGLDIDRCIIIILSVYNQLQIQLYYFSHFICSSPHIKPPDLRTHRGKPPPPAVKAPTPHPHKINFSSLSLRQVSTAIYRTIKPIHAMES